MTNKLKYSRIVSMMKNSKLPTFEELMTNLRKPEALAEAKRRAEEEKKREWRKGVKKNELSIR